MGTLSQHRLLPFGQIMGADFEKIFAFGSILAERLENSAHPAGAVILAGSIVPSGQLWVITQVMAVNASSASGLRYVYGTIGGISITVSIAPSLPAGQSINYQGQLILIPGDSINAAFINTLLNDDCNLHYSGYKMVIP